MFLSSVKYKKLLTTFLLALLLGLWHVSKTPSNDRVWSPDQAVLAYAEFTDDDVTVFNIRNFRYQSTEQYTPGYYDKTFNLDELTSIDYIVEPFGSIGAAHTFVSFGFSTGDYVAISAEIRKEVGESFSPFKGVLRNYELMYVVADERDVLELRANHRKNDVYLYPIETTTENMQQLFIAMLGRANTLQAEPEFYNTLTSNCTTNIVGHINTIAPNTVPWDLRLLLPENSDVLAYELGLLGTSLPLEELREQHLITEKAEEFAESIEFSRLIRE